MRRRAFALLCALVVALVPVGTAVAQGPAQPEAMQFEPVDVTDVVNLATGDFAYTIPLIEVPGPEGGYPLALSYHSRIGPNQPATWVGLGWSLNPGAVNRTVSGYPDDYKGDLVTTTRYAQISSWSMSIGAGWGPIGLNMHYDHHSGMVGANMTLSHTFTHKGVSGLGIGGELSVGTSGVGFNAKAQYAVKSGMSVSASGGSNGFNLTASKRGRTAKEGGYMGTMSLSAGSQGMSGDLSAGKAKVEDGKLRRGTGFSLSTTGSMNLGVGDYGASAGFSSSAGAAGEGEITRSGFGGKIPLPNDIWISFGYSEWTWTLNETIDELSHGYVHREDVTAYAEKYERHVQGNVLYAAPDAYQVSAQGINGSFRPYWSHTNLLLDGFSDPNEPGQAKGKIGKTVLDSEELHFRFTGDPGVNFATYDRETWDHVDPLDDPLMQFGRKVIPHVDDGVGWNKGSGKIEGFTVIDTDGKVYEFRKAVYNLHKYSETVQQNESNFTTTNTMKVPYATSWMITAIKGPDYVERDGIPGPSDDDWGYWVRFRYTTAGVPEVWRSPYSGKGAGNDPDVELETFSIGARQHVVLDQIESPTHIAAFETSSATDRQNATQLDGLVDTWADGKTDSGSFRFVFRGNVKDLLELPENDGKVVATLYQRTTKRKEIRALGGAIVGHETVTDEFWSEGLEVDPNGVEQGHLKPSNISYDPSSGETVVSIPDTLMGTSARMGLHIADLVSGAPSPSVRLDRIALYAKADSEVNRAPGDTMYTASFGAETVQSVEFDYDYSLSTGMPSANDSGRLTLQSVTTKGRGGAQMLPPHQFQYANGDASPYMDTLNESYSGLNPRYHRHDYDRWGSYRDHGGGNDRGPFKHLTPQDKARADRAAAWSLTSIITPTGGQIDVQYESDDYRYAGTYFDPSHLRKKTLTEGADARTWYVAPSAVEGVPLSPGQKVILGYTKTAYNCINDGPYVYRGPYDYQCQRTVNEHPATMLTGVIQTINVSTGKIVLEQNPDIPASNMYADQQCFGWCQEGDVIDPFIMLPPKKVYGGGSRVAEVRSSNGVDTYRTAYRYENEKGHSTGVASSLPDTRGESPLESVFPDVKSDDFPLEYTQLHLSHELSYGRPAPGVIYSSVEVMSLDATGAPLAGKTQYEFYTAKDAPYYVTADSSSGDYLIDIDDRSALQGRPKATTIHEFTGSYQNEEPVFRPKKRSEVLYAFSDELSDRGIIYDETGNDVGGALPGLTSERQYFENNYKDENDDFRTTKGSVTRRTHNVYRIGSRVTEYDYDNDSELVAPRSAQQISRTMGWDQRTGVPLVSATQHSDETVTLTQKTPAYWKYPGMSTKNMLNQEAQTTQYRTGAVVLSDTVDLDTSVFSAPNTTVMGASVTTWSNQFDQRPWWDTAAPPSIWMKNAQYAFVPARGEAPNFPWSDEEAGVFDQDLAPSVSTAFPWQRTSDVSKYDRYGRVLEKQAADGSRSTVLYGYDKDALVVATASKAAYDEVVYLDFEDAVAESCTDYAAHRDTREAHTGTHANRAEKLDWRNRCLVTLPAGDYHLSFWAKPGTAPAWMKVGVALSDDGSGSVIVDHRITTQSSDWARYETTFALDQARTMKLYLMGGEGASGHDPSMYHWIDQVRIHPAAARMKTYTYDPITWKVTSITGVNGISAFFEYDGAGRLVAMRDHDGNLRSRHRYATASIGYGHNAGFQPPNLQVTGSLLVSAETSTLSPRPDEWSCVWTFDDQAPVTTDCRSGHRFTANNGGDVQLRLGVYDPSGRKAAFATDDLFVEYPDVSLSFGYGEHNADRTRRKIYVSPSGGSGQYDISVQGESTITNTTSPTPEYWRDCGATVDATVTDHLYPSNTTSDQLTVACLPQPTSDPGY